MPVVVTPENRIEKWKKLWGTPKLLDETETDAAFDDFVDTFVPRNMHKMFLKTFGTPKGKFGNRFFAESAVYRNWDTRIAQLIDDSATHAEVTIIYANADLLEAYAMRGEVRRSLRDIFIDDWHAGCALIRAGDCTIYAVVELKMKGCVVFAAES